MGACVLLGIQATGCTSIDVPSNFSLLGAAPFVVSGTASLIASDGPCLVWIGENGVTYHLFQTRRVSNEDFDQVTTPGVTSRLELAIREDLEVSCQTGSIAEVREILEIVP